MKRRSFIKASALLTFVPTIGLAKSAKTNKTFRIVSTNEMEKLMDELIKGYPNRQVVIGSKITKNTKTFRSVDQDHFLVRLDINDTTVSIIDILKMNNK